MTDGAESVPGSREAYWIAPSILTADFARLGAQVEEAVAAGADRFHLDVMDGHFVPNLTIGPVVIETIRRLTDRPLDVHLMIERPEQYVHQFRDAGADLLIAHVEATNHLHRLVEHIQSTGAAAGVALNPATPIIDLEEIAPYVDMVLVMSVNPGFGGQSFIRTSLRKIFRTQRLLQRWNADAYVGVDGGVNEKTIGPVVAAGATGIVTGSAVYNDKASVADNIAALHRAAQSGLDRRSKQTEVPKGVEPPL